MSYNCEIVRDGEFLAQFKHLTRFIIIEWTDITSDIRDLEGAVNGTNAIASSHGRLQTFHTNSNF